MSLYSRWIEAKETERVAVATRREIEDQIVEAHRLDAAAEGTHRFQDGRFQIKIIGRLDHKVDGDKLQEIAAEHGLSEHLGRLFRWKPELNAKEWKCTADAITRPLLVAITTKPGRPSFEITEVSSETK